MQYRRWMHYPPYAVLANVVIQSEKLEEATGWSAVLGRWFQQTRLEKVRVLGPAAAPIVRLEADLSLSLRVEGGAETDAGGGAAGDASVRRGAGYSSSKSRHRRRCGASDVS